MKFRVEVFNCNHTIIRVAYINVDDMQHLLYFLEKLTFGTDNTYRIYNGDNSIVRPFVNKKAR